MKEKNREAKGGTKKEQAMKEEGKQDKMQLTNVLRCYNETHYFI